MTKQEKCPKCEAHFYQLTAGGHKAFFCRSVLGDNGYVDQSVNCLLNQLAQAKAEIERLRLAVFTAFVTCCHSNAREMANRYIEAAKEKK